MREKIKTAASILIILILLPYVAVVLCTGELAGGQTEPAEGNLERCVAQILPMQISVTYETEALKAQAVVIRTNLLRAAMEYYEAADWQQAAEAIREEDLAALGFTVCTEGEAEKLWSYENRQRYLEKCRTAAEETAGQVLALEGELKDLPYHAVSAGKTREGGALGEGYTYLTSADCAGDVESADYLQIFYFPELELPVIESRDSAGYVLTVRLGDETLTGEAFRFRYELNSSCFTAEETDQGVRIVTRGLGHGFGMSLYTAGRMATVALSLCLLAGVTLFGMYTVGKTEEQQRRLEQEVADAEKAAQARQQEVAAKAAREQKAAEAERQAASGSASRDRTGESAAETAQVEGSETAETDNAELEGEYAEISVDEPVIIEANAGAEAPPLSFSAETDQLLWPIAGNILMDFSMDKTVYFSTLDQYKYNPAIIIEGSVDQNVLSAASGKVISIENVDETGTTITMDIGSGYQVIYGQIKEPAVQQGDYVQAGALIGYVAEPTRFYSKEGSNLYFQVLKDGESINPKELLP